MRVLVVSLLLLGRSLLPAQEELYGATGAHDPSTLVKDGGRFHTFITSNGIESRWSDNLRDWNYGPKIFAGGTPPAWATTAVSGYDGNLWAPDAAYFNGQYHVYYSISRWGTNDSAIGLVTSPSLNAPTWIDEGKVLQSDPPGDEGPNTDTTEANCIDQSIFQDSDGRIWMVFGSYFEGIYLTELDPLTGLHLPLSPLTKIADSGGAGHWNNASEGAYLYKKGGSYYLFLNLGRCCSWMDSTYRIRVGRSTSVTGPYLDRDGVDLLDGGGSVFMESSGRFIGPGHAGILEDGGVEWFTHHYYDGTQGGAPQLGLTRVEWDADGWPTVPDDWSAFYPFNVDASEHMDLFDGTLMNGASVAADPQLGSVLALDGIDDYVELPAAVANAKTFATWVKWNGGGPWQRIFDFGAEVGTSAHLFLTPSDGDGVMRFGLYAGGNFSPLVAPTALPVNSWCHVAVTLEGSRGVLYLNGEVVAESDTIGRRPWEVLARNNYLGRSQFIADDYFNGQMDSFRVFARALSADEVWEIATAHPSLAHRYSFADDPRDSVGMAHGRLEGAASVADGALQLNAASDDYARLPGGLVSGCGAVTVEFWADLGSNGAWSRVFDFGRYSGPTGYDYLFFSPANASGDLHFDHSGTIVTKPSSNLNNQSVQIACVLDPDAGYGAVYRNGVLDAELSGAWPGLSSVSKDWSWLGRSLFSADPYLNGSIDEFRIYDGRLSPDEIARSHAAGPDAPFQEVRPSIRWTAGSPDLAWPSFPISRLEGSSTPDDGESWIPFANPPLVDGEYVLPLPASGLGTTQRQFFRLRR